MSKYSKLNNEFTTIDINDTINSQLDNSTKNLTRAAQLVANTEETAIDIINNLSTQQEDLARMGKTTIAINNNLGKSSNMSSKIICTSKKQKYLSIIIIILLIAIIIMMLIIKFA
jgi:hypothetical protein